MSTNVCSATFYPQFVSRFPFAHITFPRQSLLVSGGLLQIAISNSSASSITSFFSIPQEILGIVGLGETR